MRAFVDAFLQQSGVSSVSLLAYRRDLEKLLAHFSQHPETAKREEVIAYFTGQGKELSPSSLSRQVSVVRSFYSFRACCSIISFFLRSSSSNRSQKSSLQRA